MRRPALDIAELDLRLLGSRWGLIRLTDGRPVKPVSGIFVYWRWCLAGQMENARSELALARRGREDTLFAIMAHFPNPRRDHLLEGLRRAGLTE